MKQVRFVPNVDCGLKVREDENGQQSRVVEGRAIVFGQRSVNLTPWSSTRVVYEILERGCLTQDLINRSDVVYCLNHDSGVLKVFGRFRNSDIDTLKLELREDGLYVTCEMPETNAANDTLVLIKRGDIDGQSFAFSDDWEDTENGVSYERTNETVDGKEVWLRHVKRITGLYDVSIVTHPAYEQTNVGTREASDEIDKAIEEQIKREKNDSTLAEHRDCGGKKKSEEPEDTDDPEDTDEDKEREERELEEQAQRAREQQAMRLRHKARRLNDEILDNLNV